MNKDFPGSAAFNVPNGKASVHNKPSEESDSKTTVADKASAVVDAAREGIDQAVTSGRNVIGNARKQIDSAKKQLDTQVKQRPYAVIAVASGLGVGLGVLFGSRFMRLALVLGGGYALLRLNGIHLDR